MIEMRTTLAFDRWLDSLRDHQAKARILVRIRRLSLGNAGDVKPVGEGVSELRMDHGPGYRVYFTAWGKTIVILLVGGNKATQADDIEKAKTLARRLKSEQSEAGTENAPVEGKDRQP